MEIMVEQQANFYIHSDHILHFVTARPEPEPEPILVLDPTEPIFTVADFLISVFRTRTHHARSPVILQFKLTQLEEQTVPLLLLQLGKAEWDLCNPTVPSPALLPDTLRRYEAESATELGILGQDLLLTGGEWEGQGAGQLVKHHSWEAVRISCWRGGVLSQHRFQADPLVDRML